MTTAQLVTQLSLARSRLDREVGEALATGRAGKAAQGRVAQLRESLELHDRVTGLLNRIGEEQQEQSQRQIEELVTRGLQAVFGEDLSFHVIQEVKASQATVRFVVRSKAGGLDVDTDVMSARGGGMASVIGFVLRLVVLLKTPGARRFLWLDESFGMLSAEYEERLAEFLAEVTAKVCQVVLTTHSHAYNDAAGVVYQYRLNSSGVTEVAQA